MANITYYVFLVVKIPLNLLDEFNNVNPSKLSEEKALELSARWVYFDKFLMKHGFVTLVLKSILASTE